MVASRHHKKIDHSPLPGIIEQDSYRRCQILATQAPSNTRLVMATSRGVANKSLNPVRVLESLMILLGLE
jgi:hypothetical protein